MLLNNGEISYLTANNSTDREKYFNWLTYYSFLKNKSCEDFLKKAFNAIEDFINKEEKNYFKIFDEDARLTILIIILKAHLVHRWHEKEEPFVISNEFVNYCSENFMKYLLLNEIYVLEKERWRIFLLTFNILELNGLLISKKIETRENNSYKTFKFYNIPSLTYKLEEEEILNFSFDEYKILEYDGKFYIHTYHFSTMRELCKKNFFSNMTFKPKNFAYISKKINLKLYIDDTFINDFKKLKSKDELLEEIKEISLLLKKQYDSSEWTWDTKDTIKKIQKKYSQLLEEYSLIIFLNQKKLCEFPIYFAIFFDFRGRKYYDSIIGPTQSKILRLAYYYGYYKKTDFLNKQPSPFLMTYSNDVIRICTDNNFEYRDYFYDIFFWCLIGIGKLLINKNEFPVTELVFIETAENYFKNKTIVSANLKLTDQLEINHYEKIMRSLNDFNLNNELIKKYVIPKDATASVNQILAKKLNVRDKEALNFLNLGEKNEWYDTYLVHRDKFIEYYQHRYDADFIKKVMPRKLIKKVIMIIPYSAGFDLCWETYIEQIKEENLNIPINETLKKVLKDFYLFVKKTIQEKYFYEKSSTLYFKKISEKFEQDRKFLLESTTGEADISYFKMKRESVEKRFKAGKESRRVTKLMLVVTEALDTKTFASSVGPNIAHFYDADEIREIEIEMNQTFITIHDCYLVDILSCSELILVKQKHYNKFFPNYNVKNIFIML